MPRPEHFYPSEKPPVIVSVTKTQAANGGRATGKKQREYRSHERMKRMFRSLWRITDEELARAGDSLTAFYTGE